MIYFKGFFMPDNFRNKKYTSVLDYSWVVLDMEYSTTQNPSSTSINIIPKRFNCIKYNNDSQRCRARVLQFKLGG